MESTIGLALGWCGFSSQDGVAAPFDKAQGHRERKVRKKISET